jgi:hypothetical protein
MATDGDTRKKQNTLLKNKITHPREEKPYYLSNQRPAKET